MKLAMRTPADIIRHLPEKFWIRVHMTTILLGVTLCGVGFGKLLLLVGISNLVIRYAIVVVASYLVFLFMIRLWLWFMTPKQKSNSNSDVDVDISNIDFSNVKLVDLPDTGKAAEVVKGGGGMSGGGGASSAFSAAGVRSPLPLPTQMVSMQGAVAQTTSSSSSGGGGSFDLDGIDDFRAVLLLAALALVAAIFFGVWIYVIYQAPVFLTEAFYQILLTTGVLRKTKRMHQSGWMGSVFRATIIPFLIVISISIGLGLTIQELCPEATTLYDSISTCVIPVI